MFVSEIDKAGLSFHGTQKLESHSGALCLHKIKFT